MKKSGENSIKIKNSDQQENNSKKVLSPADKYKVSWGANEKKTSRALEGEEKNEFRASLNESLGMIEDIEEAEKHLSQSISMSRRIRGKSMDHSKSFTENTRRRQKSLNN
jgi:hypothetical protein